MSRNTANEDERKDDGRQWATQNPAALGVLLATIFADKPLEEMFGEAYDQIRASGGSTRYIGDVSGVAAGPVNVTENMREACAYFEGRGWTREQSVGIVANLRAESGLNPHGPPGDGGAAMGIAQWHSDRQAEFEKVFGHNIRNSTFQEQLAFVHYELTEGKEQEAGRALRNTHDVKTAAATVSTFYERPKATAMEEQVRAGKAIGISNQLGDTTVGSAPTSGTQISMAEGATVHMMGDSLAHGTGDALAQMGVRVNNLSRDSTGLLGQHGVDWQNISLHVAQSAKPGDRMIVMLGRNDIDYARMYPDQYR
jgi:hypothetical protein